MVLVSKGSLGKVWNILLIGCAAVTTFTAHAEEMPATYWQDLVPNVEQIENPFAKLNSDQLYAIGAIARYQASLSDPSFKPSSDSQNKIDKLRQSLAKQGIDVGSLFAQREQIKNQRQAITMLPNKDILDKRHRIPGFITPIEMTGTTVTKFFLVPSAGACIHTPPPPANQIVLVEYPQGVELTSLEAPVWVEGRLFSQSVTENVNYFDGAIDVEAVYQIHADKVEDYKM